MNFVDLDMNTSIMLGSLSHVDFSFLNKERLYYGLVYGRSVLLWSETKKTCRLRRFDVGGDGELAGIWSIESDNFPAFATGFSIDGSYFNVGRNVYEFDSGKKVISINIGIDFTIYSVRELPNGAYCSRYYYKPDNIPDNLSRSSIVVFDNGFNVIRFLSVNIPRPYYEGEFVFGIEEAGKFGVDYSRNLVCVDMLSDDLMWRYDCLVSREISSNPVDINVSMADQKLIINVD